MACLCVAQNSFFFFLAVSNVPYITNASLPHAPPTSSTAACANFRTIDKFGLVCDTKGYIATRISNVLDEIDTDSDDVITGLEQYNDFAMNIDKDNDSCISLQVSRPWMSDLLVTPDIQNLPISKVRVDPRIWHIW